MFDLLTDADGRFLLELGVLLWAAGATFAVLRERVNRTRMTAAELVEKLEGIMDRLTVLEEQASFNVERLEWLNERLTRHMDQDRRQAHGNDNPPPPRDRT